MTFSNGLPGAGHTAPAAESAASRHARDIEAQAGDRRMAKDNTGKPIMDAKGVWTTQSYDADGRVDRTFDQQKGDYYSSGDLDDKGWTSLDGYDENGRMNRRYVNYETGIADHTGEKHDIYDELKAASKDSRALYEGE